MIRGLVVVAGLVVIQFILFGSSLVGRKILLPLDILAFPHTYLSPSAEAAWGPPHDPILSDPVFQFELERRFAVSEIRSGRIPLWDPHEYCGAPFLAANWSCVFSPFRVLDYFWPGPWVIAWDQVLKALVAGIGAYLFCRRALGCGFVASAFGAWIWSCCGYYIQWAGSPVSATATWLPWLFLFTDAAVRNPRSFGGIGLALVTAASLFSGHAETAGQELLADGVFFLWRMMDVYGRRLLSRATIVPVAAVLAGWAMGILLSAPQSLPTLDYLRTSYRVASRLGGALGSEVPAGGVSALAQLVLPDFNGATRNGAYYFGTMGNLLESPATGYVGLIVAMLLAPLAACSRRHRSMLGFFLFLGVLGVGQVLALPPLKQVYDLFPLNLMRENRLVLFTGWSIAMAGAIGLDVLSKRQFAWSRWFWLAMALPAAFAGWCSARLYAEPVGWQRHAAALSAEAADVTLRWFHSVYLSGFLLSALAVMLWLALRAGFFRRPWFVWTVSLFALAEVVGAAYGVYPQSDPALYYPRQSALEYLANSPPGRVCAVHCLPAGLPEAYDLYDVRGYDGIDPVRLVDLCAQTQPDLLQATANPDGVLKEYFPRQFPSPITRMMNLRYLIFAGKPPAGRHPRFASDGYWVYETSKFMPRAFVPRHVELISDPQLELQLLGQSNFDPEDVAYVESAVPQLDQPARGTVKITSELPSHVTLEFDMQTSGMIVLSDLWDAGWKARVNGLDAHVRIANHAFRGVVVGAGKGILQFDYEPASFYDGIKIAAAVGVLLLIWTGMLVRSARKLNSRKSPGGFDHPPAGSSPHAA
jgi:hypothetical protein